MSVEQEKSRWRSEMRKVRRDFARGRQAELAERIVRSLSKVTAEWEITASARIAGYWPIGAEADVRPLLHRLHEMDVKCSLPVVMDTGRVLQFREWRPGDQLSDGPLGTRQPGDDRPESRPGILLVPGLAFDGNGWRLGQGGGYYDRTIADLGGRSGIFTIGVAYSCQLIEDVPHGPGDMPMNAILTEETARTIKPRTGEVR